MASSSRTSIVDQLLSDPMIVAVMRADRVDPVSFRSMLTNLAEELREAKAVAVAGVPPFIAPGSPLDSLRAF